MNTDNCAEAPGREMIAERIRSDIMSGKLQFGQKLSESTYASVFGVSRTPVREAIVSLQSLGLLVVRPRSGTYVTSFTQASLTDLFEVRQMIEVSGVRLATEAQLEKLVKKIDALEPELVRAVGSAEDFDEFSLADTAFHTCLVDAAENALLSQIYRPVAASAQAARSRLEKTSYVSETANMHHGLLKEALRARDIDRYEKVLRDHLAWVLGMLMHVNELFADP